MAVTSEKNCNLGIVCYLPNKRPLVLLFSAFCVGKEGNTIFVTLSQLMWQATIF